MSSRLKRFCVICLSALLIMASAGVIFWIVRDERVRLAERERHAIEAAEEAYRQEKALEDKKNGAESGDEMGMILRDIDTLLSGLSNDDLPDEN